MWSSLTRYEKFKQHSHIIQVDIYTNNQLHFQGIFIKVILYQSFVMLA